MSEPVNRRKLLRAAAGSLLSPLAVANAAAPSVIVVGAGISGLAAAADLVSSGCRVTVLEGRDRIGGRAWTHSASNDDLGNGVSVDLGAAWIHGLREANPIAAIADREDWDLAVTNWDDGILHRETDTGVTSVSNAAVDRTWNLYRDVISAARRAADRRSRDQSMQAALDAELRRRALSSADEQLVRYWASSEIEYDYAGALDDLSAWWFDNDKYLGGSSEAIVKAGYRQLVDLLSDGLTIRTSAIVKQITHARSGVEVRLQGGEILTADSCIVTVPLGVLQASATETAGITISPALPRAHRRAISGLRMGALNKLFLRYPENFWGNDQIISYASQTPGRWTEWLNYQPITGRPVLCGFNAGAYSIALEDRSDAQIAEEGHTILRAIHGNSIPEPAGYLVTKWMSDPFARGSYAHVPPGMNTTAYGALAQLAGPRLTLAGEHTTADYPNTIHGAYLSGIRAAQQIAQALGR